MNKYGAACLTLLLMIGQTAAAERAATIADFDFLVGYWEGSGFGGVSEEMWMPPRDGRMFGIFKQSGEQGLQFTEFFEIARDDNAGGNFVLRLRHFSDDFTAWEDKQEYVTFPLQSFAQNKAVFDGLSYELASSDELVITLILQHADGSQDTELFRLRRKSLD